jgi:hypothetical protein
MSEGWSDSVGLGWDLDRIGFVDLEVDVPYINGNHITCSRTDWVRK